MNKKLAITTLALAAIVLTGCSNNKPAASTQKQNTTQVQQQQQANAQTQKTSPSPTIIPTFAPTNDEDVKAMDKMMDNVDYKEYSDTSLDDLK